MSDCGFSNGVFCAAERLGHVALESTDALCVGQDRDELVARRRRKDAGSVLTQKSRRSSLHDVLQTRPSS
jgi:hypothetical protein